MGNLIPWWQKGHVFVAVDEVVSCKFLPRFLPEIGRAFKAEKGTTR
jgi:hypothetical protein